MPDFTYIARDTSGAKIEGSMTANSEADVISRLTSDSLFPVSVTDAAASTKKSLEMNFEFGGKPNDQKMATFYSQLASLLENGVPLIRSLNLLKEQAKNKKLKEALNDVVARVEDGEELSDCFRRHDSIFSDMAINMSRAGAEGGFLEDALDRVGTFTEQQADLKAKTVGAMIYPMILASMGSLIVSVLVIFFVPKFAMVFESLRAEGELPAVTEWLLWFSDTLRNYGLIIVLVVGVLFAVIRSQLATEAGKMFVDRVKLKIPLVGPILLSLAVARFCRVLGTLMKNGVPILRGLEISREAAGNRVLSLAIEKAGENVTSGETLSKPLEKSGHFPIEVTEMISVAEESNTLDTVLITISDQLEKQTMRRLDVAVKLIEPFMLLIMAIVVLFVVVALLLPIMKMGQTVG
ncbi:type II secretion system F family protein [Mariniblastus fucicola]|uniref:Type II secretion system protein F n=1 Tax=Mariniblastus fucicola TaxID=980251 RepID=A0A5B9PAC3_9BACT|nr:type II secretion system F family protein [Mariniblastus fucicola]QEG22439.1 Type II secretion system protein F [Mariniblastus fucicola]